MMLQNAELGQHLVLQISTPRSGSNIVAITLANAADHVARSLSMGAKTSTPFSEHVNTIIQEADFSSSPQPSVYFKEHGACLTESHLEEISGLIDHVVTVQRDPCLILESMLRKLLLTDEATQKESRVNARMQSLLADTEQREILFDSLHIEEGLREAITTQEDKTVAATMLLDNYSQQQGFADWGQFQGHMEKSRNYHLANEILELTFPDNGAVVTDYEKPSQFFSLNPFGFIRASVQATKKYSENHGSEHLTIMDSTAFRGSRDYLERVADSIGLNPTRIPKEEIASPNGSAMPDSTDTATIYVGRALTSTHLDKPFEQPLLPSQIPEILARRGGLFWDMIEHYTENALSPAYINVGNKAEMLALLGSTVTQEDGRDVTLMERNPVFAYVAVTSSPELDCNDKRVMKTHIRDNLPDYTEIFDRVDEIAAGRRQTNFTGRAANNPVRKTAAWER